MGEVRAKVKLTNVLDKLLWQNGQLEADRVRSYEADAVIDTGAVPTVIPIHIVNQLGLRVLDQNVAEYADGRRDIVGVAQPIDVRLCGRSTVISPYVLGDEVLIGQTVLEMLDLLVDCANRRVFPNPAHPDQPVLKIR
jgi:clan AA aspartic protease